MTMHNGMNSLLDMHKKINSLFNSMIGAVLCVRWSNEGGRYLASSSDNDNVIIIWERDR